MASLPAKVIVMRGEGMKTKKGNSRIALIKMQTRRSLLKGGLNQISKWTGIHRILKKKPDRRCFGCNSVSHIMRDCPKRGQGQGQNLDHRPPHHTVAACQMIHQNKIDGDDNEWNERFAELPTGDKLTKVAALTEHDADKNCLSRNDKQ
jgi:hypothetical protein